MSRRGWALFIAMGLIWGIPYMLTKIAVEEVSPAALVFARTAIGAAILLPVAVKRGLLRPVLKHWRALLAFTAVEICLPWLLLGHAQQELSSSLTGLLIAAVPLVGAIIVTTMGHERIDRRRVFGLLVGFAGVAALVGFDVEASSLWAVGAVAGVAVGYALGPIILSKYLAGQPGLGVMACSLAIAALVYAPFGVVMWPDEALSTSAWLSVGGLGVICTATAFVIFFKLIAEVGPARATVITYVNPAVALALGVFILNESFTPATAAGFALILAGSVLATARDLRPRSRGGETATIAQTP